MPARAAAEVHALCGEAMNAHRLGEFDIAEGLYARVLAADPGHARVLRLYGALARETDRLPQALELLGRAVAVAPDDAEARCELALAELAAGRLEAAQSALREALRRRPGHPRALANLGAVLQYRGHLMAAADCYRELLAIDPSDLEVRCNLANVLVDAGCGDEALAECATALGHVPGHPLLLAARGAVLCTLARHEEGAAVLEQALRIHGDDDMVLVNLAYARIRLGEIPAAMAVLRRAVARNPDNARAAADLVNLLSGSGDDAAALALADDFLARHPGERLVTAARAYALGDAGRGEEAAALLDYRHLVRIVDLAPPPGFTSHAAFNAAVSATLQADPSLLAGPASKSTRGGGQTGELDMAATPALAALNEQLRREVDRWVDDLRAAHATHPVMACASATWALRPWGTLLASGGYQATHMHPLGWLSGVYYAALPAGMGEAAADAGWLEFGAPPDRYLVRHTAPRRVVEPREGRLVLFASYFYHATRPFRVAAGQRISLAFDVMPLPALAARPSLRRSS